MQLRNTAAQKEHRLERHRKLSQLAGQVVGLDAVYPLATGKSSRRIYLDSTASTLRLKVVQDVIDQYQPYYANTHSTVHFGAKLSTCEYDWAHQMVLQFVRADPKTHTAIFVGSGATGGINRVARTLSTLSPDRDVVITSIMEHHSNDLPHRKNFREVVHIPALRNAGMPGTVDLSALEAALQAHHGRVNYVAITGVSNVTGIVNPIYEAAALAHRYGTRLLVDAAQMMAHVPVCMTGNENPDHDIDILVFSGHKIYAPGSPGVVVARKSLFDIADPTEVGGGMVEDVWLDRYTATAKLPDREEAGTPNICGAIGLAAALYALDSVGMDLVHEQESELIRYALEKLDAIEDVIIYGDPDFDRSQRSGALSFNIRGMHHALTAAILNDYFNISVRNDCFCAHPYVRDMITDVIEKEIDNLSDEELEQLAELQRGMVRASFGVYTTVDDIDALIAAVEKIAADRQAYERHYRMDDQGNFVHTSFSLDTSTIFSVKASVDRWLSPGADENRA